MDQHNPGTSRGFRHRGGRRWSMWIILSFQGPRDDLMKGFFSLAIGRQSRLVQLTLRTFPETGKIARLPGIPMAVALYIVHAEEGPRRHLPGILRSARVETENSRHRLVLLSS